MVFASALDVPRYLLALEIAGLLDYLPELCLRILIKTLWNISADINEALTLTLGDLFFNCSLPFVRRRTLKQRTLRRQ